MSADPITESYPLSPMQQGMLFHSLNGHEPGVDIEQVICRLSEPLDVPMFERAWQYLACRHAILRTRFRWQGVVQPCQEVQPKAPVPVTLLDWRDMAPLEQGAAFENWLRTDRERGCDPSQVPVIRVAVFRVSEAGTWVVCTFHHLLLDGRALVVVLKEVFACYEALVNGGTPDLPPCPPYWTYIAWLRNLDLAGAEKFWREYLKGFKTATPLVMARGVDEATEISRHTGQEQIALDAAMTGRLREVARQRHVTLNTIVQGVWSLLLGRYSGEDDVVFGAVRACRHSSVEGAQAMVGLLINTVPVRVRLPADARLFEWLAQLRGDWRSLRDFENTPLVEIQRWSEVEPGRPLFETIVNYQEPSWDAALRALGGAWRERQFDIRSQTNFPLVLDAYGGDVLLLKVLYHCRRFDSATIERMLGHLKVLLESMAENPEQRLVDLPLLTAGERQQLLVDWNNTRLRHAADVCVHRLFEAQVARTPEALAVADDRASLTYRELDRRAELVAGRLRARGVGPDQCVGVCLPRSTELVVALLGVWKAGGAYVPMDPDYPDDRLAFMIEDARLSVLLTHSDLRARAGLQSSRGEVICLDAETEAADEMPLPDNRRVEPTSRNLAYVIYTSGSTGTPKGVAVEHRNLQNLLAWHQHTYHVSPRDRATMLAAPGFDASVWEIWPYLTVGASLHVPDEETRMSPERLIEWLTGRQISLSFIPTPMVETMLEAVWPEDCALRAILTGGDRLHRAPGPNFPCGLINHYGPTENAVVSTWSPLSSLPDKGGFPPIGRPVSNTQVYVLDQKLRPVPVGVPGELHVGGASLARGYHHRAELTAEKFIPHPFSDTAGDRLYKTGDRVRWRADGQLEFLGRIDGQVKVRGVRIETGEIEAVLEGHAGIARAVVAVRQSAEGEPRLVACVVPVNGSQPSLDDLRAHLKRKLPPAMIPAVIVRLDKLPITPNGKVDHAALPLGEPEPANGHVAPRSPLEKRIAHIWNRILGGRRVGVHDDFFELGGHSISATQVVSRIQSEFGVSLPVRSLFDHPTVAGVAGVVAALETSRSAGEPNRARPSQLMGEALAIDA